MAVGEPFKREFRGEIPPIIISVQDARNFFDGALPNIDYKKLIAEDTYWGGHILRANGWIAMQEPPEEMFDLVPQYIIEHAGIRGDFADEALPKAFEIREAAARELAEDAVYGAEAMIMWDADAIRDVSAHSSESIEWFVRYLNKGPLIIGQ